MKRPTFSKEGYLLDFPSSTALLCLHLLHSKLVSQYWNIVSNIVSNISNIVSNIFEDPKELLFM